MKYSVPQFLAPAALAVAGIAVPVTPALAGDEPIVVLSEAAMKEWSKDVSSDLGRQLYFAQHRPGFQPVEGIVQMRFTLDAQGNAQDFKVVRSTGHKMTDRVAKLALKRVDGFKEAPVKDVLNQTFLANVIFAKSEESHAELAAQLAASERERLAANGGNQIYVAIAL